MFAQTKKLKWVLFLSKTIPMDEIPDNLKEFNKNDTYYIVCAAGHAVLK